MGPPMGPPQCQAHAWVPINTIDAAATVINNAFFIALSPFLKMNRFCFGTEVIKLQFAIFMPHSDTTA
jgi:hypothetical protein